MRPTASNMDGVLRLIWTGHRVQSGRGTASNLDGVYIRSPLCHK
jgi:hypothetical protein